MPSGPRPQIAAAAEADAKVRPSVPDLAARLADLIGERGLVAGDRFLTTEEAARLLRVRRDLANRALQVLVQRGRIERSQRIGSRVLASPAEPATFERVHIVVQANHPRASAQTSPALQVGLHAALPGCEVDLQVLPSGDHAARLGDLTRQVLQRPRPEGLVLVRCDYPMQRLAADSGVPSVLHGTPYAGIALSSIDVDGHQMGRLQAESLVERGCERLVVVRRDRALPGDRAFMKGLREVASEAGLGCDQIDDLQLAPFAEVVASELPLLFEDPARLGIICTTRELADATWAAALSSSRSLGQDLWLQGNRAGDGQGIPPFPCLRPQIGGEEQGRELGRLLAARLVEPGGAPEHRRVTCELVEPEETDHG